MWRPDHALVRAARTGLLGLAWPVARGLSGSDEIANAAVSWLRIALFGAPLILVTMAGNGWMRGVQDAAKPLRYVLAGNGISAVLCPVLAGRDVEMAAQRRGADRGRGGLQRSQATVACGGDLSIRH